MTAKAYQSISRAAGFARCRAKYIKQPDGGLRLACIQHFTLPVYNPLGLEADNERREDEFFRVDRDHLTEGQKEFLDRENARRSVRRAKVACLDFILCNPDLDTFCTFTFSPEKVESRASYADLYEILRVWLSNRVARKGLKYVVIPEYHKDGENIHFHAIMNQKALKLVDSGTREVEGYKKPLSLDRIARLRLPEGRIRKVVYNVADWKHGFSTAYIISGEDAQDKVAKYIFKYMGKQMGQKIGGKYYLHGGKMEKPVYLYGDTVDEFLHGELASYQREVRVTGAQTYTEVSFI